MLIRVAVYLDDLKSFIMKILIYKYNEEYENVSLEKFLKKKGESEK